MRVTSRSMMAFVTALAVYALLAVLAPALARADQGSGHTVAVAVLTFDSEDAEEQAEAFTGALRSRIRAAQGWSLMETPQSIAMLTAALKCPSRPPPDCQQRIGDQIKAERYIWGFVSRGPQPGQVTAEVHLYQKGKPDTVLRESYADNLKDQNDDTLRKIAQRVLERFGGTTVGVVVVRAPADTNGDVIVDGEKRVPLTGGSARIELSPGNHSVEVVPVNGSPTKRNVLVTAGKETPFEVHAPAPVETTHATETPFPTKRVIGGIVLGAGVVAAALSVQQFVFYNQLQDRGKEDAQSVPQGLKPCEADPSGVTPTNFCNDDKKAKTASAIAWTAAGAAVVAIGAGVYLLFMAPSDEAEHPTSAAKATPPKPRAHVVPSFGPTGGSVALTGTF